MMWRDTVCKTLCFASIAEFSAAWPLCLHGLTVKIALCHAQSTSNPFAPCVNFGLQIPPPPNRQADKMLIYYQYCIGYDENNGTNYVKFWQRVLKLACQVMNHHNRAKRAEILYCKSVLDHIDEFGNFWISLGDSLHCQVLGKSQWSVVINCSLDLYRCK